MARQESRHRRRQDDGRSDQPQPTLGSDSHVPRGALVAFGATIFLSAFLLFQVQPLVSKAILPWFGGTPSVWTTSMLFFQITLLAGYCYAHWTVAYLPPRFQAVLHFCLVVAAVTLLPPLPASDFQPVGDEPNPTWPILVLLARCVGVPFFALATTAPLLQVWWYRISDHAPYRLYAVSNAGSLLALLSYPFIVEPNLGIRRQSIAWSFAFSTFAVLVVGSGVMAWRRRADPAASDAHDDGTQPSWQLIAGWIFLSGCGSVLLLAMTNHLSQNVAVVPFIWVVPLALYLLSFVLTFGAAQFYHRPAFGGLMVASQFACACLYRADFIDDVFALLSIHFLAMFTGCMVCHGELIRLKPLASHLTLFYLAIATGGAAGGLFVAVLAPSIFSQYYEYPLVMMSCWIIWLVCDLRDPKSKPKRNFSKGIRGLGLLLFLLFVVLLRDGVLNRTASAYVIKRGFYGVLSIQRTKSDDGANEWMELRHGTIRHGAQYLGKAKEFQPTTYFGPQSGIGFAMQYTSARQERRVGLLGLGIGTVVAYCQPGDLFRVYEINPTVIEFATNPGIFTYWTLFEQRGATAEIVPGDARLSLERELKQGKNWNFDLLIVDVFAGDAIPVHLLTSEAFSVYGTHLADDGILAVHITNRHLNLLPVIRSIANETGLDLAYVGSTKPVSEWALLAKPMVLQDLMNQQPRRIVPVSPSDGDAKWTDDYSNIFSVLR